MLPLAVCLLLISQCLAHVDHSTHTPHTHKHKIAASSDVPKHPKIIYNYKQVRTGQDPLVEKREETIGNNLNDNSATTALTTTTTTPKTIELIEKESTNIDEISDIVVIKEKPHHHHHHHHHNTKYPTVSTSIPNNPEKEQVTLTPQLHYQPPSWNLPAWNQWHYHPGYPAYLPIMPPPPVLPGWPELDQLLNHHPHHQQPNPAKHRVSNHKQHLESTTLPPSTTTVLDTHTEASKKHSHKHHSSASSSQNEYVSPASVKPVLMEKQPAVSVEHKTKKPNAHRGDHKFNQHEVVQTLVTLSPSSTAASIPPPPPTLSPWYDGYGK